MRLAGKLVMHICIPHSDFNDLELELLTDNNSTGKVRGLIEKKNWDYYKSEIEGYSGNVEVFYEIGEDYCFINFIRRL